MNRIGIEIIRKIKITERGGEVFLSLYSRFQGQIYLAYFKRFLTILTPLIKS
jgi:hypothetical protein